MRRHATPHIRSRCERLTDRTASNPFVTLLLAVPLLALVHPLAVGAVPLLAAIMASRRRSVTA